MSCQFKNIFGPASQGIHSWRIFDTPIVDWVGTFVLAYGLSHVSHINFVWSLLIMIALGAIIHSLMCVDSRLKVPTQVLDNEFL